MYFIGQEHIINQLQLLLPHTFETKEGISFLLRGPSGYGKTEMALKICNYLGGRNYQICLGDSFKFDENVWVHFIDEVHLLTNPEILYPIIDSNKFVIILATNHDAVLQEALVNRCVNLLFIEYTDSELIQIFKRHCRISIPDEVILHIINVSGRNPRIITKTFANNLYIYYLNRIDEYKNSTVESMIQTVDKLHSIKNGVDPVSRAYIEILKILGGRASLSLISNMIKLDTDTVKYRIEPNLLNKGLIKISNRGRELC